MAWTRRYDEAEAQRVNRWLAQSGVCSRREAEALIAEGLVSVDGEVVRDLGRKIEPGQVLVVANRGQNQLTHALSVVLHKPVGVVSSQPEHGQTPAVRLLGRDNRYGDILVNPPDRSRRLAPCGRLDMDSRGLLILSEDGVVAKAVIGPTSVMEKEYLVQAEGLITEAKLKRLRHGLSLDGRALKPARVTAEDGGLRFVLKEGRNRQIRRMCDLVDLRVVDLFRVRIGPVDLGDLPEGWWRPLGQAERRALLDAARP
jgi:23S rRNA pseudouridine2604 synthase